LQNYSALLEVIFTMKEDILKLFDQLPDESRAEIEKMIETQYQQAETAKWLQTDPEVVKYLNNYNKHSVEMFIKTYPKQKAGWIAKANEHNELSERRGLQFREAATKALEQILKKKAMIKMCEWNAGLIELEGIETSHDLHYWEVNILNCPFLEPITREEVDLYKEYLQSEDFDEWDTILLPWSFYSTIHSQNFSADDRDEPGFSMFYDNRKGTTAYWTFPNLKLPIERHYYDLFHADFKKHAEQEIAEGKREVPVQDKRPPINYFDHDTLENFITQFESTELLRQYRAVANYYRSDEDGEEDQSLSEDAESAFHELLYAGETVDICESDDFRHALIEARDNYYLHKTLDAIEAVYDDYLFRLQSGLHFEVNEEKVATAKDYVNTCKQQIITGRLLAGEPGDLKIY